MRSFFSYLKLFVAILIGICMFGITIIGAMAVPIGFNIFGRVSVDGMPEDYVLLKFSQGSESYTVMTAGGGEFNFDISQLKGVKANENVNVIFCYHSWQCVSLNEQYEVVDGGRGLEIVKDFKAKTGRSIPYVVNGFIKRNGEFLNDEIMIQNLHTGQSKEVTLDNSGYVFNLQGLKYGYAIGDVIQVCHTSLCNHFVVDDKAGFVLSFDLSDKNLHSPYLPYYHSSLGSAQIIPEELEEIEEESVIEPDEEGLIIEPEIKDWRLGLLAGITILIILGFLAYLVCRRR